MRLKNKIISLKRITKKCWNSIQLCGRTWARNSSLKWFKSYFHSSLATKIGFFSELCSHTLRCYPIRRSFKFVSPFCQGLNFDGLTQNMIFQQFIWFMPISNWGPGLKIDSVFEINNMYYIIKYKWGQTRECSPSKKNKNKIMEILYHWH